MLFGSPLTVVHGKYFPASLFRRKHGLMMFLCKGPPGTGKTTTIAAAADMWQQSRCPVWIVAHSNVAVKNIAEKLYRDDINFKIIVSKEFYEEWY